MMAYLQYAMGVIFFISDALDDVYHNSTSRSFSERIAEVLATRSSIRDPEHAEHIDPALRGLVEFRDVSFRYSGAEDDVLHSISFSARPGETTADHRRDRFGKSTLVNLIPRFYDVSGGSIFVGGVDVGT